MVINLCKNNLMMFSCCHSSTRCSRGLLQLARKRSTKTRCTRFENSLRMHQHYCSAQLLAHLAYAAQLSHAAKVHASLTYLYRPIRLHTPDFEVVQDVLHRTAVSLCMHMDSVACRRCSTLPVEERTFEARQS